MINRILHSWSFHEIYDHSPKARFINFILNDHSCKVLYVSARLQRLASLPVGHYRLVWKSMLLTYGEQLKLVQYIRK